MKHGKHGKAGGPARFNGTGAWTRRSSRDSVSALKERKKDAAFGMWLACHTQEEIADSVEVPAGTLPGWEREFLEKCDDNNSRNFSDFEIPIYNVWKQQTRTAGVNHFGNSEVRCQDVPQKAH